MIQYVRFFSLCTAWLSAIIGTMTGDLLLPVVATLIVLSLLFNIFICEGKTPQEKKL